MEGFTPLEAGGNGDGAPTALTWIDRFPYYTSFPYSWYFACYADDLPAGAVKPLRYLARDLVVWRGDDGAAHVMDAYCPHLGAHLGYGGRVEGCEIVCPYHWFQYDGEGNNTKIPYSDRVNKRAKVHTYPTVDRNGLVMFWYHPTGEPPRWELPEVPEYGDDALRAVHEGGVDRPHDLAGDGRERARLCASAHGARRRRRARARVVGDRRAHGEAAVAPALRHAAGDDGGADRRRQLRPRLLGRPVQWHRRHLHGVAGHTDRLRPHRIAQGVPGAPARRRREDLEGR